MKRIPIRLVPAPVPADGRWRAQRLLSAPHRLGFFAAALMLAASGLWWCAVLLIQALGLPLSWMLPPAAAHGVWMCFGFMPLFITGFWCTAGPRWLSLPPIEARSLLAPVLAMLLGWAAAVPGFHLSAALAGAGLGLGACGWTLLCWRFVGWLRASRAADRLHAALIVGACCAGAVAWWAAAGAAAFSHALGLRSAVWAALWCFAATVFTAASHRMLPFYGAGTSAWLESWRPNALLWLLCGVLWIEGGLAVAELWSWPAPELLPYAQLTLEAPLAVVLLWLAVRWGLTQNLGLRLLAMLYTGFLWLGLSFGLAAISHASMALIGTQASLGLAPLHAMTMGFLGSTLIAMVTRVVSGHSGRAVAADNMAWGLHWLLQVAVMCRVLGALWPDAATTWILLAGLAWAAATSAWALRQALWLGQARADGRPG